MAIHFKQHSKVGEKAIAEAGFSLGDGHSTSVEYERKTLVNGAAFWFAVAIFRLMPAAQSCCSEKLLWAPEDLTKGASSEDPKIPVLSGPGFFEILLSKSKIQNSWRREEAFWNFGILDQNSRIPKFQNS